MLEAEVAETLMSLSAPDGRKPSLLHSELPWHNSKKRSFNSLNVHVPPSTSPSRSPLPSPSSPFLQSPERFQRFSLLQRRPLTAMIPDRPSPSSSPQDDEDESDVDMEDAGSYRHHSPLDGLCAAARDESILAAAAHVEKLSASRPIKIPSRDSHARDSEYRQYSRSMPHSTYHHRGGPLSRVREEASYLGFENSPTGVEDDRAWFDSYRQTSEYKHRARLASVCSSDGGSEYGGLGRKHLEEFIRMEISNANENDAQNHQTMLSPKSSKDTGKYIGSYSPDARRKRIERFLEKRKRRVWAKKVDYDVRKNFANSRLRVKGRFVKKEDEELLCQMLSFT